MDDDLDVFIMTDQPEECPKCMTRTEFIEKEDYQIHTCPKCQYTYKLIEEDNDES